VAGFLVPCRSILINHKGTLETLLPESHLARFIWRVLSDLDFSALEIGYRCMPELAGRPAYHPRVLVALWLYGMTQGMETATAISEACRLRDDFRWLAGGLCPCDQTLLNLLSRGAELASIWVQVLKAMHREGYVDLSVIVEDGTKLRANVSPRSFCTAEEIDRVLERLKARLKERLERQGGRSDPNTKARAQLRGLRSQVSRAERAAEELRRRKASLCEPRKERSLAEEASAELPTSTSSVNSNPRPFGRKDFVRQDEPDALICPAKETLRFIGSYSTDDGRGSYRLYGRRDCTGCPLKERCTTVRGRRVKILEKQEKPSAPPEQQGPRESKDGASENIAEARVVPGEKTPSKPQASLTDPEARWMLATSVKRWEPAYNADVSVTRHGIIVSQFLTNDSTDFHHFTPALLNVVSALGRPDNWAADGHYGTYANLKTAHREGVTLFAPPAMNKGPRSQPTREPDSETTPTAADKPLAEASPDGSVGRPFGADHFRHEPNRNVLICPGGQELRYIGQYQADRGIGSYRLFGRRDCTGCALKDRCTTGRGRRLKLSVAQAPEAVDGVASPAGDAAASEEAHLLALAGALQARMNESGDAMLRLRAQTVEPVNAQLKQHGVGRFHVRTLPRCGAVLTIACIAHNLMKWNVRDTTRAMTLTG